MQNLNSIERFLFKSNIYLIEKSQKENNNQINDSPLHFNHIQKEKEESSNSEEISEKNVFFPLKLLSSVINLYFYSKNPKKYYEHLKPFFIRSIENKKKNKNLSRMSSIKSQNSM